MCRTTATASSAPAPAAPSTPPPSQLLTERVASARDLPGVLAWRLGRVLSGARRDMARQVSADGDGARYAAMLAARGNTPGPAARARAELEAIRRRRAPAALAASRTGK